MKIPILTLIPSAYKTSKVYSVLPVNGDGDFDLIRDSNGTRVKENGLIETKNNNVPRLDWLNSNCPSLLLEPQRTNLALYSENFEGTNWTAGNTVITQNDSIAPSGEQTAVKLQRTSTSASFRTHIIYKSSSAITYTTSVFVKKGKDNYFAMRSQGSYPSRVDIRFRFDTGLIYYAQAVSGFTLIDYNVENYSNGWYRIYFTYTSDTHTNLSLTFSPRETDGNIDGSDISSNSFAYVWGVQTEVGNYVTSYIATTTTPVTRNEDVCGDAGNADLFSSNEGTMFVDIQKSFKNGDFGRISISDGSTNNRVVIGKQSNNIQFRMFIARVNSGNIIAQEYVNLDFDVQNKLAITFKFGEFKFYANGVLKSTQTPNEDIPIGLSKFAFNENNLGSQDFFGKINGVRYYDRVLTEAEAIKLTT